MLKTTITIFFWVFFPFCQPPQSHDPTRGEHLGIPLLSVLAISSYPQLVTYSPWRGNIDQTTTQEGSDTEGGRQCL